MKYRLFGIALAFISLWALSGLFSLECEIRSLPYELGLPAFFLSMVILVLGFLAGLMVALGAVTRVGGEA